MMPHLSENIADINTNTSLAAALNYAARGWRVVPVNSESKVPFDPTTGRNMGDWQHQATVDQVAIMQWWTARPDLGVAIATGATSGILVIDIDVKGGKDGAADLAALEARYGVLPATLRSDTPSRGWQLFFAWPAGVGTIRNAVGIGAVEVGHKTGVDIRATGGQVNVAPTIRGGVPYRFNADPATAPLAELPAAWVARLLQGEQASRPETRGARGSKGSVGEGGRNDTLFREASKLRGLGLDPDMIEAAVQAVNLRDCQPPLSTTEVSAIVRSALRYDPNGQFERNDTGNAARFLADHGERVRFATDVNRWLIWDGRAWLEDKTGGAMRLALETATGMAEQAALIGDQAVRAGAEKWARISGDRARLKAMLEIASADPRVAILSTEFDNLPGQLVVANGVADLRTGELLPHDPARLTTKAIGAAYIPSALAPRFQTFLDRVLPNPEVQQFVQRYLGHALTGHRREQLLAVWHGRGANGKSVLAEVVSGVVGPYGIECPSASFLASDRRDGTSPRSDLLRLRGSRIVFGAEVPDRRKLDGELVKKLTGDATLTTRGLYASEVTFAITFGITLMSNPFPGADEADDALWRRLVRVPFDVVIPEAERDKTLAKSILLEEAEGVLAWLVRGAIEYETSGLPIPAAITAATRVWRRRVGAVERFLGQDCAIEASRSETLHNLHRVYASGVARAGGHPLGIESFRQRLEGLGFTVAETDNFTETVLGLGFRPAA